MRTTTVATAIAFGIGLFSLATVTPRAASAHPQNVGGTNNAPGAAAPGGTQGATNVQGTQGEDRARSETATPTSTKNPFEGDIQMRVTTDRTKGAQNVGVAIKGDRVRWSLPPSSNTKHQPLTAIVDAAAKKVILVMPADKSYAVLDLNSIPPQSKQAAEQRLGNAAAQWSATKTGVTKSLAGHPCDEWQANNQSTSSKIDACLAPDVRIDFDQILPSSMLPTSWADKMRNGELPLSATVYDGNGKQTFSEQVTRVVPRVLPDSEFQAPAGYNRVDLPLAAFTDLIPQAK